MTGTRLVVKLESGIKWLVKLLQMPGVLTNARFTFMLKIDKLVYNEVKYGRIRAKTIEGNEHGNTIATC